MLVSPLALLLTTVLVLLTGTVRGFMQPLQSQFPASPVPGNRIVCQNFTDFAPMIVFMYAADDFVVPQPDLALRYTALQVTLGLVRMKHDDNPHSFTLQLLRNDDSTDSPGRAFFAHSYAVNWSDAQLDVPFNLTLRLAQGDANELDNNRTQFDPMDEALVPRDTRLWLALYATGPRNWVATMSENSLFWSTEAAGGHNATLLPGGSPIVNRPYFFRDTTNALREGFVNWTAAPLVERAFGMDSVTHNLAWSLDLVAQDTEAPTGPPTNATASPATGAPSGEPSGEPAEEEIVWPNVTAPTRASNGTTSVFDDARLVRIVVSVVLSLVVTCCLCALCLYYCIKRRKFQKLSGEKTKLENLADAYRDERTSVEPTAFTEGTIESSSSRYRQNNSSIGLERSTESTSTASSTTGGGGDRTHHRYDQVQSSDDISFTELSLDPEATTSTNTMTIRSRLG